MNARPQVHDKVIAGEFYVIFAQQLRKKHPFFVKDMSEDNIIHALSLAGPPATTTFAYAKALEKNGWSEITDDVLLTLASAPQVLRHLLNRHVQVWLLENKITCPIENGQDIQYGDSVGHGFITDNSKQSGQVLFRNEYWIKEHGHSGGVLVNWEDVLCINDSP